MASSELMFPILCKFLIISGLFSYQHLQGWKSRCFKIYLYFTLSILVYGMLYVVYGALTSGKGPYLCIPGGLIVWVIFDTVYFYAKEEEFRKLLKAIENLKGTFEHNSFMKENFGSLNADFTMKIQRYMKYFIITQTFLPFINGTSKLIRFWGLFGMDGQISFLLPCIYDIDFTQHPFIYVFELYFQVLLIEFMCLKESSTEGFFTCMFLHMTLYFNHLYSCVPSIYCSNILNPRSTFKYLRLRENVTEILETDTRLWQQGVGSLEPPNDAFHLERYMQSKDERNIKTWAKMHQELLKVSRELVDLYNPVLLVQFGMMFFLFVVLAFTISMQTHKRTLDDIEITIISSYWFMIMTVFFIMCLTGNELHRCSMRVFDPALSIPWYSGSKSASRSILIIGERCRKPLRISLYCSEIFHLSTATFVWIMKSVLTVLVALMQVDRRRHGLAPAELH